MTGAAARGLTLALGIALGALGSALFFETRDLPSASVEAADTRLPSPKAPDSPKPVAPPRDPLAAEDRVDPRPANDAPSRIRAALADTEAGARSSEILDALEAAYARGELADEDLVQLLFAVMLNHGNPEAALDLVTRFRPHDSGALVQIAQTLAMQGKQKLAQEVITRAMAVAPDNQWVLNQYATFDPAGALPYFLARLDAQEPPGDPALRMEIAQLYANAGREVEARAQLEAMLEQNPHNQEALQYLSHLDPASAERRVRDLIAAGETDSDWHEFLFDLVLQQGRIDDALALLERDRALGVQQNSGAYGTIAEKYLEQHQTEQAVAMWSHAFELEQGDPDSWTAALQEYAPEKLLSMLEARTSQGANDEFWGALGDSYWREGRHSEALIAWREAVRLDPEDDEWPMKLAAAAAGNDPM
ncbi:MAG TPA: tetratricopeptide repeat protein [Planctomycetota bacterium]|nr:tetratricopeptide repeat protein [Planctomycetota bacterium]